MSIKSELQYKLKTTADYSRHYRQTATFIRRLLTALKPIHTLEGFDLYCGSQYLEFTPHKHTSQHDIRQLAFALTRHLGEGKKCNPGESEYTMGLVVRWEKDNITVKLNRYLPPETCKLEEVEVTIPARPAEPARTIKKFKVVCSSTDE